MSIPVFSSSKPKTSLLAIIGALLALLIMWLAVLAVLAWLLSFALTIPFWNAAALVVVAVGVLIVARGKK